MKICYVITVSKLYGSISLNICIIILFYFYKRFASCKHRILNYVINKTFNKLKFTSYKRNILCNFVSYKINYIYSFIYSSFNHLDRQFSIISKL